MKTLIELRDALADRTVTARSLVEECLQRAQGPGGEGARVFISIDAEAARATADALDRLRASGTPSSPWAGIPISVKDLFDVRGQITRAGSTVLAGAAPAAADCEAIARLRRAGFVLIGRTNMTEFAFSGVGINPHYGTPRNPWDRVTGRVPGGSSAGAAVSVTDGMSAAGIGTDTGGSCRIPAALCGIVGFKPTARRIPRSGVYPLSRTLDSVGPLASSVGCCAVLDGLLSGTDERLPLSRSIRDLHFAVLGNYVTAEMDSEVRQVYERALARLRQAGAKLSTLILPDLEQLPGLNARGGIAAAEAYAQHRGQLAANAASYDPRVGGRIARGAEQSAADYIDLLQTRAAMIDAFDSAVADFDAVLAPTVPIVAPPLSAFETDDEYVRLNLLLLRNPSVFNFLDGCAISIPIHEAGEPPVGLMLAAPGGRDRDLLSAALAAETCV